MNNDALAFVCPVCGKLPLTQAGNGYVCANCGLTVTQNGFLGFKSKDQYTVKAIGDAYALARLGLVGWQGSPAAVKNLGESVYADADLAAFAAGNFESLRMPGSTLAQVLLEQLKETCYIQVNGLRRANGPILEAGSNRIPTGTSPANSLVWQDAGNLFLTDARLVFPSDTFTFIRLDRKLVGLKTFTNGIAVQRRGEDFATYFVGCRAHQAALLAAYIQGRVSALQA